MAIITISRGTFTGGQVLAECIADNLGYRCISREVLVDAAKQYGKLEEILQVALIDKPVISDRTTLERIHYLSYVRAALIKDAKDEKTVYHGHAGHLLLRGVPHVLRVRVIADMEFRIKAVIDRKHISREEAIRFIKKVDDERAEWTRFLYQVDWNDSSLYDIVINIDRISLSDACDVVSHMANMEIYRATSESKKTIDDLELSSHLRAMIAADKDIEDSDIQVTADGGVVTIDGTLDSTREAEQIKAITRKIPHIKEVNLNTRIHVHS